jgi:murein DD-endopeptidase
MNPLQALRSVVAAACMAGLLAGCATMRQPASEAMALPDGDAMPLAGEPLPDLPAPVAPDAALTAPVDGESPQQTIVARAQQLLGVRYRYGGSDPRNGFDCSGFVRYVFREMPVPELPRASAAMIKIAGGMEVARDALEPGDLLFFKIRRNVISHVAIYLGDDRFIHAPSRGGTVRVETLDEPYWRKHYAGARRILALPASGSAAVMSSPAAR